MAAYLKITCEIVDPVIITGTHLFMRLKHKSLGAKDKFFGSFDLFKDFTTEHWSKLKPGEFVDLELTAVASTELTSAGARATGTPQEGPAFLNVTCSAATFRLSGRVSIDELLGRTPEVAPPAAIVAATAEAIVVAAAAIAGGAAAKK